MHYQLELVRVLIGQLRGIRIDESVTLGEFLLHARSLVSPWLKMAEKDGVAVGSARGRVLLAMVFAALQAGYPRFDALVDDAVERFTEVGGTTMLVIHLGREDIIRLLDSVHLLPYVMDLFEKHIRGCIADIVREVAFFSANMTGIVDVCRQSVQQTVLSNFSGLSISGEVQAFADACVLQTCLENRFSSLFDLVALYPDSHAAVVELEQLVKLPYFDAEKALRILMKSCEQQFMCVSLSTETIIGQFVQAVPIFKRIDASGLLLDRTARATKEYLLEHRADVHDAVFKIFCVLTDKVEPSKPVEFDAKGDEYLDYMDAGSHAMWLPDPIAAGKDPVRISSKSFDPFAVLVNFSARERLFECLHKSTMDALAQGSNAAKTLKRINIAANFVLGKKACSKLLVMLHDHQTSLDVFGKKQTLYSPLVISHHYWPKVVESGDQLSRDLPGGFPELAAFTQKYAHCKPGRSVQWIPSLSSVDMDLTIEELNYNFTCVPYFSYLCLQKIIQKAALSSFNDNEKEGLLFWAERGFIRIMPDNAALALTKPSSTKMDDLAAFREFLFEKQEDASSAKPSSIAPHIAPMVVAMLTNLGPMPASRIHGMLRTMSGLKESVEGLIEWLHTRPDVQFDPVTGAFCRATK